MPRNLSEFTLDVLWWLWHMPWACAADITMVMSKTHPEEISLAAVGKVDKVLERAKKRGWLHRVKLGRVHDTVWRYVFSEAGVEQLSGVLKEKPSWWHSANGVLALARRLEVLEMAYLYLPRLWQSNLVVEPTCYVYRNVEVVGRRGESVTRPELKRADWRAGRLVRLIWLQEGPFEAIAIYDNGNVNGDQLFVPILWRGDFHKLADISQLRREMGKVLVEDERWLRLPVAQWYTLEYVPGMVILSPGRVPAAMAQRHWRESLTGDGATNPAIIDATGQVVRPMRPPTAWWKDFPLPMFTGALGDIAGVVRGLSSGPYAAVNGVPAWRAFRAVDRSPGVTESQIAESVGAAVSALMAKMKKEKVITIKAKGYYLKRAGRALLAYSQRQTPQRVKERWGSYTKKDGKYLRSQRIHNQGQAYVIIYLNGHGYAAFPAMGIIIEYWHQGERVRIDPDAFVVLAPGVLVAVEYERSADTPQKMKDKADNYLKLQKIGHPIPVLFVTEKADAAIYLAGLRIPYLLATSQDALKAGPHGKAPVTGNEDLGCWWNWDKNDPEPTGDAPIDLWSTTYAERHPNGVWRVPVDRPFVAHDN